MKLFIIDLIDLITGLRKFTVMVSLLIISTVLLVKGLINGEQFADLLKGTALGFFASNAIEQSSLVLKTYINSKGQKEEEIVPENPQKKDS